MAMPSIPDPQYIQLEQTKFALRTFVAEEVPLNNLEVNAFVQDFAYGVVLEFRTHIWSHKLPPETFTAEESFTVATYNSAWQLWKANHAESKWFGWVAKRWPPEKRGTEVHKAVVSFDMTKKNLFPEYDYPAGLGTPYHVTVLSNPKWTWDSE
jgi:hypothetical protein